MQQKNHRSISLLLFWKGFLLICLPLWTLPTFFKNKNVWKIKKTLKNVKNVTKIKNVKTFFYIYGHTRIEISHFSLCILCTKRHPAFCNKWCRNSRESEDTTAGRLENRRRLQAAAEDRRRDHKRSQEVWSTRNSARKPNYCFCVVMKAHSTLTAERCQLINLCICSGMLSTLQRGN